MCIYNHVYDTNHKKDGCHEDTHEPQGARVAPDLALGWWICVPFDRVIISDFPVDVNDLTKDG